MFGEYTPFRACQVHQIQVTERCGLSDDKIDGIEAGGSESLGVCRQRTPDRLASSDVNVGWSPRMVGVCPGSGLEQQTRVIAVVMITVLLGSQPRCNIPGFRGRVSDAAILAVRDCY